MNIKRVSVLLALMIVLIVFWLAGLKGNKITNDINVYYDYSNTEKIIIDKITMSRYNEKINKPKMQNLIKGLSLVKDNGKISLKGLIDYSIIYAYEMDPDFETNWEELSNGYSIKVIYVEKIIKEVFDLEVDIKNSKGIEVKDNKIIIKEMIDPITDVQTFKIEGIYNDRLRDEKVIKINVIRLDLDSNIKNNNKNFKMFYQDDFKYEVVKTMILRYKDNKTSKILLDYTEEFHNVKE
ncbi:MAG: hypothetical protein PHR25_00025 [Clostridia bacterium]|nr:hypothetical protein [Clostridia bacterium]MDD4375161.1 hypothetical protein [Clostridia bacterium]